MGSDRRLAKGRQQTWSVLALAFVLTASASAKAQTPDEQLTVMVADWIHAEATDLNPDLQQYVVGCVVPVTLSLPDNAKRVIVDAGGMNAGLEILRDADPEALGLFVAGFEPCFGTTFSLGERILEWTAETLPGVDEETRLATAFCVIDAFLPLSEEGRDVLWDGIYAGVGPDFRVDVVGHLVTERPDLAGDIEARFDACLVAE